MAKPVEENYLITIKGTMEQNGENDTVELMTRGNFVQRGNSYYIVYAETEATGYAGCTTTVRVSQDGGELQFSYTLDSGAETLISRNSVLITVEPLKKQETEVE